MNIIDKCNGKIKGISTSFDGILIEKLSWKPKLQVSNLVLQTSC